MSTATSAFAVQTVIEPRRSMAWAGISQLWRYRELWWTLAVRDLRVRYKQTFLGAAWAVIQPVVTMIVLHLFFGKVMGMADRMGDVAYPIFLFAGNLPWVLFANSLTVTSNSLVANGHILSKVYFPRLILPLSAAVAPVVDYMIAFVVLLGMMWWFDVTITWRLFLLAPLVVVLMMAAVGLGSILTAMMVTYRDIRHIVPFLVQTLFFMTPVIYPVTLIPQTYRWLLYLNPLTGTIESMRAVVLSQAIPWSSLGASVGVSLALLGVGVLWFSAVERKFADII